MTRYTPFVATFLVSACASSRSHDPAPRMTKAPDCSAAVAGDEEERVELCSPGPSFRLGGDYVVIRYGRVELLYRKVEYRCETGGAITFPLRIEDARRIPETCQLLPTTDAVTAPFLLFLREVGQEQDLPMVYSRTDIVRTIAQLFSENPCVRIASQSVVAP